MRASTKYANTQWRGAAGDVTDVPSDRLSQQDLVLRHADLVKRIAYHLQRNEWSIHFNLTQGETLFTGDGGDPGQVAKAPDGEWIELFHPQLNNLTGINDPDFWQPGVFHSEHLVNMSHHYYREEPNVRFSPDKKLVIFTSNMFGASYVLGVEAAKAVNPNPSEVMSTPELAARFNPTRPTPTGAGNVARAIRSQPAATSGN